MWSRIKIMMLSGLFIVLLAGCNKGAKQEELLPVTRDAFSYSVSEKTYTITVDDEGRLYTVKSELPKFEKTEMNIQELEQLKAIHTFEVYDTDGKSIMQKELKFGTGRAEQMLVVDGTIYCITPDSMENFVYIIDTKEWNVMQSLELPGYQRVYNMVLLDDYLYVLGKTKGAASNGYNLHPDVILYNYLGEQISRINLKEENPQMEKMKVDFPISIYATEQDTLMIYRYTEEHGFGFLEFDPTAMTLMEQEWYHTNYARNNVGSCGDGYTYTTENKLYYGTTKGVQVQLLPDGVNLTEPAVYRKGFAFFRNMEHPDVVKRVCVLDIIQENNEIRMLTNQNPNDFPYGCGYQMSTQPATTDEFALKVLAQDSDFDLFLLSSRQDCAYNLQKNGAFYALNDVEGVEQYLDACFPYIKELAVNEDGDIWMVPVGLAIPGMIYNKEFCEENGVEYVQMDYLEFLSFMKKVESEEPDLASMAVVTLLEELFMQYLTRHDSFDTDIFRSCISRLREIYAEYGEWGTNDVYGQSLSEGTIEDFYLDYAVYSAWFAKVAERIKDSEGYGISGIPRIADGIGNVGTITILAVNPQSENLEDTLKYITDFCNYMVTKQDSFVLADESMYTDTPFIREQYRLYANGAVDFRIDSEVYLDDFISYVKGEVELEDAIAEAERKMKIYKGE